MRKIATQDRLDALRDSVARRIRPREQHISGVGPVRVAADWVTANVFVSGLDPQLLAAVVSEARVR